jgi:uncharacterized protein (TIGR02996 family)
MRSRALLPPPRDDTEARLLAEIDEHHADDGPRGVYADWLAERGDRQGELFAIQLKLERGVGPWERHVLDRRKDEILRTGHYSPVIYRRGVPDGVRLDPPAIKDELPAHLQLMRWSTTTADDYRAGIERLAAHPRASHVVELDLGGADPPWMLLLAGALRPRRLVLPRFRGPDEWIPRGWMAIADIAQLRDARLCERVEQLELSGALDDAGLAVLAEAAWLARVTELVSCGTINYGTVHGLGYQGRAYGPIGDAGVRVIANHMPALARLDLRWNRITAEGVRALADSPLALTELRLSLDGLGVAGLAALERSRLAGVARVTPGIHARTEPAAYRALLESPLWAERWLDLWVEPGFDLGPIAEAIAQARGAPPIEELRIRGAKLDAQMLDRLLGCPALAALRHLAIVEPVIGREPAVFGCMTKRPLETLFVMRCTVGAPGLAALLESPHAARIENLDLEGCELGDAGVRLLASSAVRPIELHLEDRVELPTHLELLGSPVLARTELLWLFLRKQSSEFDTAAVKRVLLESPHLAAVRQLSLLGLEAFSKEDKLEVKRRFAGLQHPGIY